MNLSSDQIEAIKKGAAVYLRNEEVGADCVVVRADVYQQDVCPQPGGAVGQPLSLEQQRHLLQHVGEMAGWNDPEMDVYDQLDPRRP